MTSSADPMRRIGLILCAGLLAAGCSSRAPKPDKSASTAAPPPAPTVTAPNKGDPDQRFKEALKLMKDKQPKEAYDAFLKLAKDFPEFSGPLTDLAILQANAKQRAPAIINFQKAAKANPQNYVALNWLGALQREAGDFAAAEAAYRAAIAANADYAPAHLNLAILYDVSMKRPADALDEYRAYQRIAGSDRLIVTAWIRDLEERLQPTPSPAPAASPAPAPERKS